MELQEPLTATANSRMCRSVVLLLNNSARATLLCSKWHHVWQCASEPIGAQNEYLSHPSLDKKYVPVPSSSRLCGYVVGEEPVKQPTSHVSISGQMDPLHGGRDRSEYIHACFRDLSNRSYVCAVSDLQ